MHMHFECGRLRKAFITDFASVWPFPCMRPHMASQTGGLVKAFKANGAKVSFLLVVLFLMKNDGITIGKSEKNLHFHFARGKNSLYLRSVTQVTLEKLSLSMGIEMLF